MEKKNAIMWHFEALISVKLFPKPFFTEFKTTVSIFLDEGVDVTVELHCVPRTTVSFQKHATPSKIDRFSKIFHWVITNALTFV